MELICEPLSLVGVSATLTLLERGKLPGRKLEIKGALDIVGTVARRDIGGGVPGLVEWVEGKGILRAPVPSPQGLPPSEMGTRRGSISFAHRDGTPHLPCRAEITSSEQAIAITVSRADQDTARRRQPR